MKICFLIRSLYSGGAERQLVVLSKGLVRQGHNVAIVVFYSGGELEEELEGAGVRIRSLHKRGRWDLLPFIFRLSRVMRDENPDVLHPYLTDSNVISVVLKPFFKRVKIVWAVRSSAMDLRQYNWLAGLSFKASCWLSRFADAIIMNSRAGGTYHVAMGYPKEKSIVIPNGIDPQRFRPDIEARVRVRSEWGVKEQQRLVGLVARLDPMKDHRNFLNAAALLMQKGKQLRFVCVGGGPAKYRASLQEFAKTLGVVEYIRWVDTLADVSASYNALDLLVSSSAYGEGFSNVIGEAMACGVPCVVTDVGDSAWLVGDMGEVVPPKNSPALANAIQRMLDQKSHEPTRIRQRVESHFSVVSLVTNTEHVLNELLSSSR